MKKKDARKLLKRYHKAFEGKTMPGGDCKLFTEVSREGYELLLDTNPCSACAPCVYRLMDVVSGDVCVGVGFTPRLKPRGKRNA